MYIVWDIKYNISINLYKLLSIRGALVFHEESFRQIVIPIIYLSFLEGFIRDKPTKLII